MLLRDFGLALTIAFAAATCFYPALRLRRGARLTVLVVLTGIVLSSPLVIPPQARFLRMVAAAILVMPPVKMWDQHYYPAGRLRPSFVEFLFYLPNPFNIVWRRVIAEPKPPRQRDLLRVAIGTIGSGGTVWICYVVFAAHWRSLPLVLEHCTKLPALFLVILVVPNTLAAGCRMLGIPSTDFSTNFFLARTPAEFWRGYNRPAEQFFYHDVFKALNGPRRPWLGMLATFGVSGLVHEYVFDLPAGRVQGYQLAFFMIQGVAVITTARLRPTGWRAVACNLGTIAFMLASGALFFASMNECVPFYVRRLR
jgi:hypothetical protein